MRFRATASLLVLLVILTGCGRGMPPREDPVLAEYELLTKRLKAELRACVTSARTGNPRKAAKHDFEKGEWRLLTYKYPFLGTLITVPGVENCEPLLLAGYDRVLQIGGCGEIPCGPEGLACQEAEVSYRTRYNREMLIRAPHIKARNCAEPGTFARLNRL